MSKQTVVEIVCDRWCSLGGQIAMELLTGGEIAEKAIIEASVFLNQGL